MLLWPRPLVRRLLAPKLSVQVDRRCAREESQSRGAAAARSGARVPPMRARAPPLGGQARRASRQRGVGRWCGRLAAVTVAAQNRHKSTVGGTGDRCGDAGLIRGLRCADHDRAPRPPRTRRRRSTNQPRRHRGQKSRDLKVSRHAPNGRRERSTWRRWAHPWAAPRRSRPRTPTSRTRRRHSSQPTSMSSRRKISRPRFSPARTE